MLNFNLSIVWENKHCVKYKNALGGVLNRKHKKQDLNRRSRFKLSGTRLALSILVFLLGFIGIGLLQNITIADDTNPNNETVDCNFYIFIHDENGNPMSGVKVDAYDDENRTNLIGTSSPSETNGWAHLTTCKAGYKSFVYFKPDISTLPEGQKKYQKGSTQVLESMVNVDALTKGFFGDEYIIEGGTGVDTEEPAVTKASSSLGEVFPGADLDPDGIVGYDANRYESWLYSYHTFLSFEILPGEPEPTIETGNLQITKTTSDNNTTDEFNVTVTLSGTSTDGTSANTISGTYGDATFDDGIATISIKHNQTKNITGLPAGIDYSIEETNPGDYVVRYENQTGTITKDQTATATVSNLKEGFGDLRITKKINGAYGYHRFDMHDTFMVTVALSGTATSGQDAGSVSGVFGDVEFVNGVARFEIEEYQTINITGLPAGLHYMVDEDDTIEYMEGYSDNRQGVIKKDSSEDITITNKSVEILIRKWWITGPEFSIPVFNEQTGEWEFKLMDVGREEIEVEATFEIEFDDIPDGEYLVDDGAAENVMIVQDNKGVFSIKKKTKYVEKGDVDSSLIRIKGIPVGTSYSIEELSARNVSFDIPMEEGMLRRTKKSGVVGSDRDISEFINGLGKRVDASQFKLNLTKQVLGAKKDKPDEEYEFTILPLFSSAFAPWRERRIADDIYHNNRPNVIMSPETQYSVQLHGKDGDRIVDVDWFAEHGYYFWTSTMWQIIPIDYYKLDKNERLIKLLYYLDGWWTYMEKTGFSFLNGDLLYANAQETETLVNYINNTTDNFFEYEGARLIELSKKLQAKINALGYDRTSAWFDDTWERGRNAATDEEKLAIMTEFIGYFTETGWTVDDFRFAGLTSLADMFIGYDSHHTRYGSKTAYEVYNDINDLNNIRDNYYWCNNGEAILKCGDFDLDTNKYFFGRTFKLKDGESIQLNFPAWWAYEFGALILEKKTGNEEYTQSNSIITSMLHVEKDENGDYVANATYKNTYPEPESEQEPEKEEPKETPVEVINPKTEDKKLTTLIIMMGSAVMLVLALVSRRTVASHSRE